MNSGPAKRLKIICEAVCQCYCVPKCMLLKPCRTKIVATARNVCFYLSCKLSLTSRAVIGLFYKRSSGAVNNGYRRVDGWLSYDRDLKQKVERLYDELSQRFKREV